MPLLRAKSVVSRVRACVMWLLCLRARPLGDHPSILVSCCPMFMLPRNPFDEWPKWWTMTDAPISGSTRVAGSMEPLYWSPASPVFEMVHEEAKKLPQKV